MYCCIRAFFLRCACPVTNLPRRLGDSGNVRYEHLIAVDRRKRAAGRKSVTLPVGRLPVGASLSLIQNRFSVVFPENWVISRVPGSPGYPPVSGVSLYRGIAGKPTG